MNVAEHREDELSGIYADVEKLTAKHEYGTAAEILAKHGNLHAAHQTILDGIRFEEFEKIVKQSGINTLKVRNRDSLDFHELHVGTIVAMMEAAFEYGRAVESSPLR